MAKNNNELLSNLGNFVNRVLKFTSKNFTNKVPKFTKSNDDSHSYNEKDRELLNNARKLTNEYINALENVKIKEGLRIFMELSSLGNAYLQETAPWTLMKTEAIKGANILFLMCNFVRLLGTIAEPYMPSFSAKLYELMDLKYDEKSAKMLKYVNDCIDTQEKFDEMFVNLVKEGDVIKDPLPLFKESMFCFSFFLIFFYFL